ncbi:MAG: BatD family protein [Bacteroidota bacterium]
MILTKNTVLGFAFFLIVTIGFGQKASIKIGQNKIGINQYFTITIQVENERLKKYSEFPGIEGFVKRGTSSSTSTNFINGRMSSTQSLTQNYQATAQGKFTLSPFTMTINDTKVQSNGILIEVGEPVQRQSRRSRDPFDDFFNRSSGPTEYIDVEADAFAALSVDKNEVFVGEGFTATLAFYVAEANEADMRFYDLSNQITEIVKKVKPSNCWEENFSIDQIVGDPVKVNGKDYTRFKIYQTTYFPLTVQDIAFPSVGLKMIKYKVAKNRSTIFGRSKKEDYETFYSKPKKVTVRDLPPHPLKDQVAVGNYRLEEKLSVKELSTGESFNYDFNIRGVGNISAIEAPSTSEAGPFDLYPPNVKQNITRANGRVSGTKGYNYYGIPNEPGTYDLGEIFSWVFFNPNKEQYDTLQSNQSLVVTGGSRQNLSIASNDLGDFYDRIGRVDNSLQPLNGNSWFTIFVNILAVVILGFTAFLLLKRAS